MALVPLPMWWVIWFVFGACIGSFMNVCIHRMPRDESIKGPRSRCPRCWHMIAWYDNIPLASYVALRAACRHCGAYISWRYPLVELLTGLLAIFMFSYYGFTPVGLIYFAFLCGLIVITFTDLDFQIIPDQISLGGLAAGLAVSFLVPELHGTSSHWTGLGRSLLGALVGGGLLYVTAMVGDFIFRRESMGGGDIKLLAMAGAVLGWKTVLLTFFLSPFLAVIPGFFVLLFHKEHVIPYGPFLAMSLVILMFFEDRILAAVGIDETVRLLWEYLRSR